MAYKPTNWVDHVNSGNKYKLTNNPDGTTNIDYAGKLFSRVRQCLLKILII